MKKRILSLVLVLALALTALVGCDLVPPKETPAEDAAAIYTMDVNPGLRIYVDTEGKVITVEATNDDGEEIVNEITFEGVDFEEVTERIIDALDEAGYLVGEEGSLLLTLEKAEIEISEKLNKRIEQAYEKHGKAVSVIEQRLDKLDEKIEKEIEKIAKDHHISRGKAHLIKMIREEFPEMSEEELAALNVQELRMLLEDTTDAIKDRFDKFGEIVENEYKSREQAAMLALAALEIDITSLEGGIPLIDVHATGRDGVILYKVEVIYGGVKYELLINAESGEIVEREEKEYEKFDPEAEIDKFLKDNGLDGESIRDHFENIIHGGKGEGKGEKLTRGEVLDLIIEKLGIEEVEIISTDVDIHNGRGEFIFEVEIETQDGTYELVVEAFSGEFIRASLNGEPLEEPTDTPDAA